MMKIAALVLSIALLFALGCTQGGPGGETPPVTPLPGDQPPLPPSGNITNPIPPSLPAEIPQPGASASQPAPPAVVEPAPIAQIEPAVKVATISEGKPLDFGEGYIVLDDVWVYHSSEPVLISIYYPDGTKNASVQKFPFSESRFVSKSGTAYWIAVGDTMAGYDISIKRAKFYVFSAKDNDTRFSKALYSDIVGERDIISASAASLFGKEVAWGLVNKSQRLDGKNSHVRFDDMDREPASEKPALVTFLDPNIVPTGYAKIGIGKAYVYKAGDGKLMAAYNEAAFTASNGSRYLYMRLYEAGQSALENRTYAIIPANATARPAESYKIGKYSLAGSQVALTERQFSLMLSGAQSASPGSDGVVLEFLGADGFFLSSSMLKAGAPITYTARDGRKYSLWLDSASGDSNGEAHATISMYKVG